MNIYLIHNILMSNKQHQCGCGNNCDHHKYTYSFWKYVVFAIILYVIFYNTIIYKTVGKNEIITVVVVATVLLLLSDNTTYFHKKKNPENYVNYPNYKQVPNLNSSPNYNKNNNFQMHDKAMNYYYGFYGPDGTTPTGNDLQNFYVAPLEQNINSYVDVNETTQKLASFGITNDNNYNQTVNDCSNCKIPGTYTS
jgi:hypothetical protein